MEANDKVIQTAIKHSRLMDRGVRAGDPNDTCVSFVELFGVGLVLINSLEIFCLTRSHVSAGHNWIVYIRLNKCLYFMPGHQHDLRPFI